MLTAEKTKQAYATALADFLSWSAQRGEPLSKPLVESWKADLLARGLRRATVPVAMWLLPGGFCLLFAMLVW